LNLLWRRATGKQKCENPGGGRKQGDDDEQTQEADDGGQELGEKGD